MHMLYLSKSHVNLQCHVLWESGYCQGNKHNLIIIKSNVLLYLNTVALGMYRGWKD